MLTKKQMLEMKMSEIVAYLKAEAAEYKGAVQDELLFRIKLIERPLVKYPELGLGEMKLDMLTKMMVYTESVNLELNTALEHFQKVSD